MFEGFHNIEAQPSRLRLFVAISLTFTVNLQLRCRELLRLVWVWELTLANTCFGLSCTCLNVQSWSPAK